MRNKGERHPNSNLSVSEIENVEKKLLAIIQGEAFERAINYLTLWKQERDPGKMPCRSRISKANVPEDSKRPILLPAKTNFSELVMKECHGKVMQNGINDTLCAVRENFWIIRRREATKRSIRSCTLCKRHEGLPTFSPELPKMGVDDGPPFINVRVDFAGPLMVENKGEMKCYVCLFTCASTRAAHLELMESLDIESFIRAFRRFMSCLSNSILSENAKTYKAATKEVSKLL